MPEDKQIQQPPEKIRKVYDAVSKKYDVGSFDQFKVDMQDPSKNKKVYDVVSKDFDIGDYDNFQKDLGINGKKKEPADGSVSPSGSSQKQDQTGQPVSTSGSAASKALTNNYKDNSITPDDLGQKPISPIGPSPEQISHAVNNKGKNLDKWQRSSGDNYITSLVNQHQDAQKKLNEAYQRQAMVGDVPESEIKNLSNFESTLRSDIQKAYDARKQKVVPGLLDDLKGKVDVSNWADAYGRPDREIMGVKIKSPLEWNPDSHKLTMKSVQWVARNIDDIMNRKGDKVVNAQVSGDLEDKKRTYADLTKSVVDYLNTIPIQKAQQDFTKKYTEKNPQIKDAFTAVKEVNDYFSKANVDAVKAKVNTQRDKEFIKTGDRYYGDNGVFNRNQDYIQIAHKYAQLVHDGTMTDAVARKQIMAEIDKNPSLKKIKDTYESEIRKINENTQKEFQSYLIAGLRKEHPKLTIYKDGSVGLADLSQDQYKNMIEGYEEGLDAIAKKMGGEQMAETMKQANEKAKRIGAFWGSAGESINEMSSALSKFIFNKTQWGGEKVQYYEAQEIASPSISQSDVAASWNWKGIESLKDPNFWLSKTGSMVPVIAGASAVGLATDGAGMPEYVGWLANAGLFTAQSGLSTYNQLLNTRDAQGNLLTEADASHYMASQMEKDFLANLLMMAATSGTILRAKNIVKPTIAGTIKKGILGAAEAQPFFTWQGYNDYATSQEAQGKRTDFWDYMQSKDFKDNLINGMVVGSGLSLLHAPGSYMKSIDNWTKMVHTAEGEFKNLIPQNYALGQEMAGNGNSLRDGLKLHIFNTDPDLLTEAGKRELEDKKNTLLYSTYLDKNIRTGNLDRTNIQDLYQAHNLALADQHDYLSEQAKGLGNKTLAEVYKDKAKDYREQAKAAANGEAKYHYLINDEGHPIFMSDKSFKVLEKEGTIAQWMKDGTIENVHKSDDPEFAQRYKDFVGAKDEATVEGKDVMDHADSLIEENKDKLGVYYAVAKENPEMFYREVADQAYGIKTYDEGGIQLSQPSAEKAARDQYGNDIVDLAKVLYPITEKEGGEHATTESERQVGEGGQPSGEQEHTRAGPPREEEAQPQTDSGDSGTDRPREVIPEDNITVSEMLDKKGTYKGQKGTFLQDGQTVIFKVDNSNREYELGNVDEVGKQGIHSFGVEPEKSIVDVSPEGKITVRGKEYVNPHADPLKAIIRDKEGNIIGVKLQTPEGQKRTFRGQAGQDLAYQLHLKQISDNNEQPAFEQFINEDEPIRKEIDDARFSITPETETIGNTGSVQREKIETVKPSPIQSPIKTEENEKVNVRGEGEQGNAQSEGEGKGREEGGAGDKKGDVEPTGGTEGKKPPAPPISQPREPKGSSKEEFTSVRKEKNAEIKGAKELFERQKVVKWTETYDKGLSNVQAMYPDKGLYDAMKARIGHFTAMLDSGTLFNPTSEDIAVFNVFKDETKRRINEIQGWDSTDNIHRLAAVAEFTLLQNDLFNVARVTNPGGEAGRAFNLLQSEIAQDPEYGLQIRRMELLGAKGGGKLTQADLEFTADNWEKEKALMQKEQELKAKGMQEKFDKEMAKIKESYEKKLKEAKDEKKPTTDKEKREKLLKEKGADLAARIRRGKDILKGTTMVTFPGLPQAINVVLEGLAKLVEGGYSLAQAIDEYVQANKIKNKEQFTNDLFTIFNKQDKQEESYDKIQKLSQSSGATDVTNDMVAKNLIRDYVNAHVGLHEPGEVLSIVHDQLKKILPDIEKNRLIEAYLKQGDFKQPTKKDLESGFKQAQKNFDRLVKLEKDINDLSTKSELFKKSNNKPSPYVKEIEAKEREKKEIMDAMGVKTAREDKYTKASYDERAKLHNDRLDEIGKSIQDKVDKGGLSEKSEKALIKLKNQLGAAKIKIDPNSALSQEKTLEGGISLLKSIKSEFQRNATDDITKIGNINRSIQKIIDQFSIDKDESDQNIKLQRAKDQAKRKVDEYFQKIQNEEYEDRITTPLTKTDAELIQLQRNREAIGKIYRDKRKEYEKTNKTGVRRVFDLARAGMVDVLIGSPFTLAKVAGSAILRPNLEAATKLTFGKGFELLPFETTKAITEKAKAGGEGSSLREIKKGYEAYFRQYSQKQLEDIYTKSNDKYESADKEFINAQTELDRAKYANGKDSEQYRKAESDLNNAKNKRDDALIESVGNSVYQYISGSSLKEGLEVLLHRSAQLERQFGDFDREAWEKFKKSSTGKEKIATAMDNAAYVMNFVGRSHAALKNFSARFSFASGFMSRLEYAVKNGVDISNPDKILEIAHESYLDWDRGKYQEPNWVTDTWNKVTNAVEKISPEMAYLMRADVAITRVPVNMLREGIMEYTLGAFRGSIMAAREYYKAKGIVLQDGYTPENEAQFKKELREQLDKMDPDKAATIIRSFRKGGFGLGLYALGLIGHVAFGGWAHKGQTAEDKKKALREQDTGISEIKTSEIKIGDWKLPEFAAKIAEHTPAFYPLGFGLGLSQVYQNNIVDGRTTVSAATNAAMAQVNHITNSLPMIDKIIQPLAAGAVKNILPSGQWDDVDQDGNPMKRKAFNMSDYLNYLPGYGSKKDILSEAYYKQAVSAQRQYREAITEVETNISLSSKDKEEQRQSLLKELDETIDQIYKENKENPQ